MSLTDGYRDFQQVAERFTREKVTPGYTERKRTDQLNRDLVRAMGGLGLLGPDLPEKYGGLGEPSVTTGVVMKAIAYGNLNLGYAQLLASLNGQIIAKHASATLPPSGFRAWFQGTP